MAGFQLSINGRFWVSTEERMALLILGDNFTGSAFSNEIQSSSSLLPRQKAPRPDQHTDRKRPPSTVVLGCRAV